MLRSLTCLGALAVVATPITAQRRAGQSRNEAANPWKVLSEKYDKNKDGKITREEHNRGEQSFARLDRDGDGFVTEADLEGGPRMRRNRRRANAGPRDRSVMIGRMLARSADADGDGKVSAKEWKLYIVSLDKDGDGTLAGEELLALRPGARQRRRQARGGQARGVAPVLVRVLDTDRDGTVAVTEVTALFARLDADKNEVLAGTELGPQRGAARLPRVGKPAPDFTLPFVDGRNKTATLSSHIGKKPVALIFGSYT